MSKQPNILFLMTDQHRHDGLGCVNPVVQTPNLDALAARGVRFTDAVCNVPMCVASRYSMMTGQYGCQVGVRHNTQMIPRDDAMPAPTLPQLLADGGYQAAGIGKKHWYIGAGILPDVAVEPSRRGFEVSAQARRYHPSNGEPGALYMADDKPEWFTNVQTEAARGGPGGESTPGYIGATSDYPAEQHPESWLTEQALRFLETRDAARPFFLNLSLDAPHPSFMVPAEYENLYDLADFPDNPPPDPAPDDHVGGKLATRWPEMTPQQRRRSRLRYAALCTFVDDLFGRVLRRVAEMGALDNTLVLFASDHGEMLGDRGRVSKYCLYEGSVRVPMILAGPGVEGGRVDDRPAELVDIVPTLLEAGGLERPERLAGLSLLGDIRRDGSFAEMHGRGYEEYQRAPAVMYRTPQWKLILHQPGRLGESVGRLGELKGELYRLGADPLELNNLYRDPAHAEVRERMTAQLLMHVMCAMGRFPAGPARARIEITGPETMPDNSIWPK